MTKHYLLTYIFKNNSGFSLQAQHCRVLCHQPGIAVTHTAALHTGAPPPRMAQGKVFPRDAQTLVASTGAPANILLSPTATIRPDSHRDDLQQ